MFTDVSAKFRDAIRRPHTIRTTAVHRNLWTGDTTVLTSFILDGTVTDDCTSQTRRTLNLTLAPSDAIWQALNTVGGEITVNQYLRYVDGSRDTVPMGVFIVDTDQLGYGPGDTISITAPDRMGKVQKNTLALDARASVPGNAAWQEIKRLIEGAWNATYTFPGWSQLDETATTKVGSLSWDDGDRGNAIADLCTANSLEVFPDRNGLFVLRPIPVFTSTSPPSLQVVAGAQGVMISADRTRDRTSIRNSINVSTTATDVTFTPVTVENTTAGDPLSVNGPLGRMAEDYALSTLRNSAQALAAGKVRLSQTLGVSSQVSLEAVGDPTIDSQDVGLAIFPKIDRDTSRPSELHVVDVVAHPLAPTGTQSITTRATVAAIT